MQNAHCPSSSLEDVLISSKNTPTKEVSKYQAIRACAVLAFAYMLSFLLRTVNGVISPSLVGEFSLTSTQLGLLTSAYFLSFGLMQVPLGICLDRFGPRKTNTILLFIAILGCLLFSLSQGVWSLTLSRILIGLGVSGCLMAAMVSFRLWFSTKMQSRLPSWMMVVGICGALLSTIPVYWFIDIWGWRYLFVVCAALFGLALLKQWAFLPNQRSKLHQTGEDASSHRLSLKQSLTILWKEPLIKGYLPLAFFGFGGFLALQGLWMGAWFRNVWHMNDALAAQMMFVFNLILAIGFLFQGIWASRWQAKGHRLLNPTLFGMLMVVSALSVSLLISEQYQWLGVVCWFIAGLGFTVVILIQTEVVYLFPKEWAGRSSTFINASVFLGAFTIQFLFGVLIDIAHQQLNLSQRLSYSLAMFCYVISLLWSVWFAYRRNQTIGTALQTHLHERLHTAKTKYNIANNIK